MPTTVKKAPRLPWERHRDWLQSRKFSTSRDFAKIELQKFYMIQYYTYVIKKPERKKEHDEQLPSKNGWFDYPDKSTDMLPNRLHTVSAVQCHTKSSSILMTQRNSTLPDNNNCEKIRYDNIIATVTAIALKGEKREGEVLSQKCQKPRSNAKALPVGEKTPPLLASSNCQRHRLDYYQQSFLSSNISPSPTSSQHNFLGW